MLGLIIFYYTINNDSIKQPVIILAISDTVQDNPFWRLFRINPFNSPYPCDFRDC